MTARHILAIDLAKRSFQVCATDRGGAVLCNRVLSRARLQQFLSEQSPCIVAMEACATSRFWGRFAQNCGHDVRLILAPNVGIDQRVERRDCRISNWPNCRLITYWHLSQVALHP
ncbi:hypothetical protein [Rhizobium bangladeshense]|uniref:hypothetical protein n=1 Tax=Rhizobium bangladeshense TaxID=1138189 RepID=UPI001C8326CA|nr:hypothetical protein [Rhizobium bangladeshense]